METQAYTIDYFIEKYSQIPDRKWTAKKFVKGELKCAFGHLGCTHNVSDTEEAQALHNLLGTMGTLDLFYANDGQKEFSQYGTNPKERVINFLKAFKDRK